jgi:uncharacterized membrane protein
MIIALISEQIVHLIFSWSSFLSWLLFICDLGLMGFLSMRAYRDGESSLRIMTGDIVLTGTQSIRSNTLRFLYLGVSQTLLWIMSRVDPASAVLHIVL